jgi:hypothetical protein
LRIRLEKPVDDKGRDFFLVRNLRVWSEYCRSLKSNHYPFGTKEAVKWTKYVCFEAGVWLNSISSKRHSKPIGRVVIPHIAHTGIPNPGE